MVVYVRKLYFNLSLAIKETPRERGCVQPLIASRAGRGFLLTGSTADWEIGGFCIGHRLLKIFLTARAQRF
jgi:hypothetical protein